VPDGPCAAGFLFQADGHALLPIDDTVAALHALLTAP
jgi:hypothetical protein